MDILTNPAEWLKQMFLFTGVGMSAANLLTAAVLVTVVALLSYITNIVAKLVIRRVLHRLIKASRWEWDEIFMEKRVFLRLSHLAPALVILGMAQWALDDYPRWSEAVKGLSHVYMFAVGAFVLNSVLDSLHQIYLSRSVAGRRPIKGYIQLGKIMVAIIAMLFIAGVVFDRDVSSLVLGLGGMAAILMLVFQDTITGLVSSIQLTGNNMLKVGDWISIPSRGVDGDIIEMTLYTVKVQNFDKTVVTVPTNALMRESFQNWAAMAESGGRRIMRSLFIDMKSVKFVDAGLRERLYDIEILRPYIEKKEAEIEEYNKAHGINVSCPVNGRRMTNLGTFRAYIEAYLVMHPDINSDMIFMVRQMQPDERGLPLQLYAFSRRINWVQYEGVQANIFDHLLAVIGHFDLRVFQDPSGDDLKMLATQLKK